MKTIKTWLFTIAALLCCITANAHGFEVDGIYYNKTSNTEVSVTYRGSYYDSYSNEYSGNVVIPSTVRYSGKEYSVTSIGDDAFRSCSGLTSVTIPNSVTSIEYGAFRSCSGLTSVTIPNSVTSIEERAFYSCDVLTSVTIGNSVTSIGSYAFDYCSSLRKVLNFSKLNISKGSSGYGCVGYYAYVVLNNPEIIDNYVFAPNGNTYALYGYMGTDTNLQLPEKYKGENYIIGSCAFYDCSGLTSVTIPNSVTSIGDYAFYSCDVLTSVTIGNSVTSIGHYAFWDCSGLTSVTIGNSVTSIGLDAFDDCSSLRKVLNFSKLNISKGSSGYGYVGYYAYVVLNNPEIIDNYVFAPNGNTYALYGYMGTDTNLQLPEKYKGENYIIGDYAFYGCSGLTSVTIPNSVTSIGGYAFSSCSGLTSVTIGNSVKSIGGYAFEGCSGLISVTIGNSVTSIGDYAFRYCSGLISVTIPNSVESIGDYAFYGCSGLTLVTIGNSVTSIGSSAFWGCSSLRNVLNFSNLNITKGSSGYGYVGYYAYVVANNAELIDNYVFSPYGNTYALYGYMGTATNLQLPEKYKGENYIIGDYAFYGCSGLTSVTIGNSVESIGSYAFYGCSGLTSVTIPNSVTSIGDYAFRGCSGLTSVTIGNSVTSIGDYAFNGCNLKNLIIGTGVLSIGSNQSKPTKAIWLTNTPPNGYTNLAGTINYVANDNYTQLSNIKVYKYLSSYFEVDGIVYVPVNPSARTCDAISCSYDSTATSISIDETVSYKGIAMSVENVMPYTAYRQTSVKTLSLSPKSDIGDYAFYGCTGITNATISNEGNIGANAFSGCTGITNATISNEGSIGTSAFEGAMTSANGTLNVTNKGDIGELAFSGCTGITNATISNEGSIGANAFSGCTGITNATISNEGNIGTSAFEGAMTSANVTLNVINKGDIYNRAFYGCTGITNATISNEGSIGTSAFEGAMTSANVTLNVTNKGDIYNRAFSGCTGITNATISNEGNIGTSAFEGAMRSGDATLKVTIPGVIEDRGFYGCANLKTAEINIVGGEEIEDTEDTEDTSAPLTFDDWTSTNTANSSYSSKTYTFNVQGEATLSFDWWVSSEGGYDKLIVTLDGTTILDKSGDTTSGTFTTTVGSGSHTLVVKYSKDNSNSNGQDKAKVSNIKVVLEPSASTSVLLSIGNEAFRGCNNLSSITLGDSIKSIGNIAFSGCSKLTEVTIPNKTTSLGEYCFSGNSLLANIDLGNGLKTIGRYCFSGCSMPEISIPASVTSIGNYTFNNCSSLADVVIEDRTSELTLGSNGSSPLFASCPLDSVYIGGKIKYNTSSSSGYSPFYRNTSLRTIVITDEEEEIYDNEFYGCTSLKNVTMGDGVKKIGNWAFSGCSNLDYFNFGCGMQSIGDEAFSDCTNLTMLISYAEVPPTCGSMALDDINKWECVLRVPQNSLSAYQAADQWKEFFFIEDVLTGINEIEAETEGDVRGDVYSLNGTLLKRNVNVNRLNSILPAGLYVVNGKKVVVK